MNFTMDLTTSVTILSGLATFLGFVWSIFHSYQKKKDESDSEDDECQDKEESIEKLPLRTTEAKAVPSGPKNHKKSIVSFLLFLMLAGALCP